MNRIIIDVREQIEFKMGHVEGAINMPLSLLKTGTPLLDNIPKDIELIVYCNTGNRSAVSQNILYSMGYTNVVNGINREIVEVNYL